MNPVFELKPDPKTVRLQLNAWSLIQQISDLIALEAEKEHWENVVVLADKRERMVQEFFAEPLCMDLYQTVIDDIEQMKAQHETLIDTLTAHNSFALLKEKSMRETREHLVAASGAGAPSAPGGGEQEH